MCILKGMYLKWNTRGDKYSLIETVIDPSKTRTS